MMNPEVKALWLAALRSGKYKQTKGRLRAYFSFCCLGVLCDLYAQAKDLHWAGSYFQGKDMLLPESVIEWAGLDSRAGKYGDGETLSDDNDHGMSFDEIADIIEKNF